MNLPTTPQPALVTSPKVLLLYGPPKIGKTTILSALPGNLLVDIEDGSDYVPAIKIKLTSVNQFAGFEDEMKKQNGRKLYKFGSLDTLDRLEEWAEVEATRRYKASLIGKSFRGESVLELPNGGGYMHLRNVFYEYFRRFYALFDRVIFIGHIRDKMLTVEGKEVSSKDLDLTGKVRNIVCSFADAIGHTYRDKDGKLKISFITTDAISCGSRCEHLKGRVFDFDQPATVANWKQIYPDIL